MGDRSGEQRMPAVFIGHGSPMNTFEHNRYTDAWQALGAAIPVPRAILAVSAHWYVNATAVTAMARPRTIHDFFGFPDELFAFDYPAPGDPDLAAEIIELVRPTWCGADHDSWGLDHGTWSVLAHMFPGADVPVVQLSIDATKSPADHVALGSALAPLRDRGVLVVGSGNVVHHLGMLDWSRPDSGYDWALGYDEAARSIMETRPGDIDELFSHEHHHRAAPTSDHLLPLFYIAGIAAASGDRARAHDIGYAMGSLSMTCYTVA